MKVRLLLFDINEHETAFVVYNSNLVSSTASYNPACREGYEMFILPATDNTVTRHICDRRRTLIIEGGDAFVWDKNMTIEAFCICAHNYDDREIFEGLLQTSRHLC
jgi:hypothetical protein